jgi:uncharacterized protein (DUF433 family)
MRAGGTAGRAVVAMQEERTMTLTVEAVPVPLRADEHGALRVSDSRVVLDVVVDEFEAGASPEAIAHTYPTLQLADVYAVLAFYLRHRDEVTRYLRARAEAAEQLRREIEASHPERAGLREMLLARREKTEHGNASPGE